MRVFWTRSLGEICRPSLKNLEVESRGGIVIVRHIKSVLCKISCHFESPRKVYYIAAKKAARMRKKGIFKRIDRWELTKECN